MKKDCLTTFSKVDFNTFEPEEDKIRIEDIAHALSMMTRANGHFPQFFSVGQHCIQCCHEATARNYLPQTISVSVSAVLPVCFTMEVKPIWRTLPARSRKT